MARPLALNRSVAVRAAIFAGGLVCGVGLTALIIDAGHGQSPPIPAPAAASPPANASQPVPAALSAAAQAAVDKRIAQLAAQLGITPVQMPLWSAFAAAMRDNTATTDALFAQRVKAVATMNAAENMRSYAELARAYAENTQRLAAAFDSLYASLTDAQKQAADGLFREQAAAKPQ